MSRPFVIGRGSLQHPLLARPPAQVEIGWPRDAHIIVASWVMDHLAIRYLVVPASASAAHSSRTGYGGRP